MIVGGGAGPVGVSPPPSCLENSQTTPTAYSDQITAAILPGSSITVPADGDWVYHFTTSGTFNANGSSVNFAVYVNGVIVLRSDRSRNGAGDADGVMGTHARLVGLVATDVIDVRTTTVKDFTYNERVSTLTEVTSV